MPVSVAGMGSLRLSPAGIGYCCSLAALLLFAGSNTLQNATANGDTRTISFHHTHTQEDLTVTYKVNGRYDEEALKKINWTLRDWRTDEPTKMDPHLLDIVWEVYREVGGKQPIHIISAYRSPATNALLRRRSSGVAKFSQHMLGKAMDFYIPDASLEEIRYAGLRLQRGGVGFYPTSGSPFVHLDTGSVRHWPRMPEQQLARVLAKGPVRVASSDRPVTAALKIPNPFDPLAKLFGGGRDEEDDNETAATTTASTSTAASYRNRTAATAPRPEPSRAPAAAPEPKIEKPIVVAAVPMPPAKPAIQPATFEVASATSRPVQLRPASGSSLVARATGSANDIINERGFWQGLPDPQTTVAARTDDTPRPPRDIPVVSADATGSVAPWSVPERATATSGALAYAPALPAAPASRAAPMGEGTPRAAPAAQPDTTVAIKRTGNRPTAILAAPATVTTKPGERFNNPWMRAVIVSPSVQEFLGASLLGMTDFRHLGPYLHKPASSVMMTFSADPYLGMTAEHFSGSAVVFMATVTFGQRTAALR